MRCIALLGGSFDPVHHGHVALGIFFAKLLRADELRIIPMGQPAQKQGLQASSADRVEMVRRAFHEPEMTGTTITIDTQEIVRDSVTYTIDTLRMLRAEYGDETSLVFLMGADQLRSLNTWREWRNLFNYAHIGVASRPGFFKAAPDALQLPPEVAHEFFQRASTLEQIRTTPHGKTYAAAESDLAIDISATAIRAALQRGEMPTSKLPPMVLDYIERHNLYKN